MTGPKIYLNSKTRKEMKRKTCTFLMILYEVFLVTTTIARGGKEYRTNSICFFFPLRLKKVWVSLEWAWNHEHDTKRHMVSRQTSVRLSRTPHAFLCFIWQMHAKIQQGKKVDILALRQLIYLAKPYNDYKTLTNLTKLSETLQN